MSDIFHSRDGESFLHPVSHMLTRIRIRASLYITSSIVGCIELYVRGEGYNP